MTRLFQILFTACFMFTCAGASLAQEDLFGPSEKRESRRGFVLAGHAGVDLPAGDMAKRFGVSYRLGPGVMYKTTSNWLFGAKFDFIVGSDVREDSLMINIRDKYATSSRSLYEFINNDGNRIGVPVFERGYSVGLSAGRIFNKNKSKPDNGFTVITTAGFIQHRINIFDKDKSVMSLRGNYLKGYDRLANGLFVEQFAGYSHFSQNKLINFTVGLDFLVGFTQGRRDYLYDVMRPDNAKRLDILCGVKAGWYIPIFKRNVEDILFE